MKLEYTQRARDDLTQIVSYIAKDSPENAHAIFEEIKHAVGQLSVFPESGIFPKDIYIKSAGYRMLVVKKFLVFYKIQDDTILIAAIIHGAQNYKNLF